ncbi:MAG: UHRF1BP1/VPS13 N-terminal domain-containing protein, partial [archaeon]|nr:UHRF1BP1/VPS13 N-terminal domain-containing protein [archaeon]
METVKSKNNLNTLIKFLKPYLQKIFENVDLNVIIHEEGTSLFIREVEVRKDILMMNNLPFEFKIGKVSEIKLEIENLLTLSPMKLEISGISIQIKSVYLSEKYQSKFVSIKDELLNKFDVIHKDFFFRKNKLLPPFIENLLYNSLENFQLKISDLKFAFVEMSDQLDKKKIKQLELRIKEISSNYYEKDKKQIQKAKEKEKEKLNGSSSDEGGGDEEEMQNKDPNNSKITMLRNIQIKKLFIYLCNSQNTNLDFSYLQTPLLTIPLLEVSLNMTLLTQIDNSSGNTNIIRQLLFDIKIDINNVLSINVSKHKILFLINFADSLVKVINVAKYWHNRPAIASRTLRTKEEALKFLKYAFLTVRNANRQKKKSNNKSYLFKEAVNIERYHQCYLNSGILENLTPSENTKERLKLLENNMKIISILHCRETVFNRILKEKSLIVPKYNRVQGFYNSDEMKWLCLEKVVGKKIIPVTKRLEKDEIALDFINGKPEDVKLKLKFNVKLICINFTRTLRCDKKGPFELPSQLEFYHDMYQRSFIKAINQNTRKFKFINKINRFTEICFTKALDRYQKIRAIRGLSNITNVSNTSKMEDGKSSQYSESVKKGRRNSSIEYKREKTADELILLSEEKKFINQRENEKEEDTFIRRKNFFNEVTKYYLRAKTKKMILSIILTNIGGDVAIQRDQSVTVNASVLSFDILDHNHIFNIVAKGEKSVTEFGTKAKDPLEFLFDSKFKERRSVAEPIDDSYLLEKEHKSIFKDIIRNFCFDCIESNNFRNSVLQCFLDSEKNFLDKSQSFFNFFKENIFSNKSIQQITKVITNVLFEFLNSQNMLKDYKRTLNRVQLEKNIKIDFNENLDNDNDNENINFELSPRDKESKKKDKKQSKEAEDKFLKDIFIRVLNTYLDLFNKSKKKFSHEEKEKSKYDKEEILSTNFQGFGADEVLFLYQNSETVLEELKDDIYLLMKIVFLQMSRFIIAPLIPYFIFDGKCVEVFYHNLVRYADIINRRYLKNKAANINGDYDPNVEPFIKLNLNKNGIVKDKENLLQLRVNKPINIYITNELIAEIIPIATRLAKKESKKIRFNVSGNIYDELSASNMDVYDDFVSLIRDFCSNPQNNNYKLEGHGIFEKNYIFSKRDIIEEFNKEFMNIDIFAKGVYINLIDKVFLISYIEKSQKRHIVNEINVVVNDVSFTAEKL